MRYAGTASILAAARRRAAAGQLAEILSVCLLLLMAANMLTVISRKSLTNDEFYHIPAGYYHLTDGNFQLNNEHPPLVKMLASVPLLFLRLIAPPPETEEASENPITRGHHAFERFWVANSARFEIISFWSRVPMIALAVALGLLIFIYARQLFGARAAAFAVALYSLEPNVLAHGRVVQTDLPAALAYLLFWFTLQSFVRAPTLRRALKVGAAIGLALVIKFSMVIVIPIWGIAILVAWRRGQRLTLKTAAQIIAVILIALFVVNIAYCFQRQLPPQADMRWLASELSLRLDEMTMVLRLFSKIAPPSFLFGMLVVAAHNHQGHSASLLGAYSDFGWWHYFPTAFTLKTTLPFLLLSVVALTWASWRIIKRREKQFAVPLAAVIIYTVFAMTSNINIGVRHFLPAFPPLFILGGALLDQLLRQHRRAGPLIAAFLLCWIGFEAARAYPHYMSHMNQLAWRHPRWHYLSDSNVEWGDDARELALYLHARGETQLHGALLGSPLTLQRYGVEFISLFSPPDARRAHKPRYVAIGASFLNGSTVPPNLRSDDGSVLTEQQRHDYFAEYRTRAPEAVFGNSIYLYRVGE